MTIRLMIWALVAALLLSCPGLANDQDAQALAQPLVTSPAVTVEKTEPAPGVEGAVKVTFSFGFLDPKGQQQTGHAKVTIPAAVVVDPSRRAPLYYGAGYETTDEAAAEYVSRGFAAASPLKISFNPVARNPNLDIALLHIVRALPFVDDAKVSIAGGSAGGYMTFMLAAETFPLAAAVPMVAPVNFGYQMEYFRYNHPLIRGTDGKRKGSPVPVLAGVYGLVFPGVFTYYPEDLSDPVWLKNSPIAHVDTITCPVLAIWSTGDTLVPIHQVSRKLVRPHDPKLFPAGFKVEPEELMPSESGWAEFLPALREEQYTLTVIPAAPDWQVGAELKQFKKPETAPKWDLPFSATKPWDIVILDEGPIMPKSGHFYHFIWPWDYNYIQNRVEAGISPDQLTMRKLERLMARYVGVEWLGSTLRRLDRPEAERADVLRGLITYVSQDDAHAQRFAKLYAALPADRQSLGPAERFSTSAGVVAALQGLR